ncbi:VIT1/CCC1 family predicted Fe2+/Mn2+ transporter [Rhodococcus sp. PvR044]|jgi:vacuolar iron transporter family protein|uniref:VIT1/CCC1 transporter family protein n=1 Tax=unclassified Rhodococcus (in: high G+C Gram-positive bacteria) TaxID=192944 RepID=UPI000BD3EC59|nr:MULTISPECIES: VIT1/CCC1 transporter family protein [unclassified Rhodococcus (in: high G+C Gram-positive bacteria)]MBP1157889.1 VIT1/CCC1 family predicted Fe2+/Mn2+ transporter [Rhodococcus sp. PvR099]PTR37878.1 VIT1/CCC1 family predicted Fe2+/Mn2+ transporter [Rhodococcus sp. OK611]SNX93309.1 Predicted Fe2+/Mn2+ transporter, VIT1/CCC1 family [Rhodococcus sp. OK270]
MSEPQPGPDATENALPHEFDHTHSNVSGGWLRAATFGAMDGLVTNTSLIAGVGGAGVDAHTVILSGVAGLVAGAFSMALGEFASVSTANEQIEAEVKVETRSQARYPEAEQAELVETFTAMGMSEATAEAAAAEVHNDSARAVNIHLTHELGVNPSEKPSPLVAAGSSFLMFCVGAIIPLIPYLLGFESLVAGLTVGGIGLLIVGAIAASFTAKSKVRGALRQLAFGGIAVAATYLVGALIGVGIPG